MRLRLGVLESDKGGMIQLVLLMPLRVLLGRLLLSLLRDELLLLFCETSIHAIGTQIRLLGVHR